MTTDAHGPERRSTWRNLLTWIGASFVALLVYSLVGAVLLQEGPVKALPRGGEVIGVVLASVLLGSTVIGLSYRRVPFNAKNFATFLVMSALSIVILLSFRWLLVDKVMLKTIGVSTAVPLVFGLVLVAIAVMGLLVGAVARRWPGLLQPGQAELLLEQGRVVPLSLVVIAAMGAKLVLLSLAGPGGPVAPGVALVGVVVLIGVEIGLTRMIWPLIDELSQTLSRETGNASYYLIAMVGGGWATLAHLRFVPVPTPLDWLTMFTVFMLAASLVVLARRGLLAAG